MKRFALGLGLAVVAAPVQPMTLETVKQTCPIGGEVFEATLAMSGTQFGQNLDRRPWGPTPAPWPLAKCPGNGLVLIEKFTPAQIATLTPYVLSAEYQALQARETNYYLAARLAERLGMAERVVAFTLLKASWEVEDDPRYSRYATEALDRYRHVLAVPPRDSDAETLAGYGQIATELERRLGRFDAARARATALLADPAVRATPLAPLLRQELTLIEQRDARTHRIVRDEATAKSRARPGANGS